MGLGKKISSGLFFLFFMSGFAKASEDFLISIHLFRATPPDGASLKQAEILSIASYPELSVLEEKLARSEYELTAAVIDLLMDKYQVDEIEDLFLHEKPWNGLGKPMLDDFAFGDPISYRIKLQPEKLPSGEIAVHVAILQIQGEAIAVGGGPVIDQDLALGIDDPVIVAVPHRDQVYFMLATIAKGIQIEGPGEQKKSEVTEPVSIDVKPKITHQVDPFYPEALRRRGIGGKIGLRISVNEEGIVRRVEIVNPGHAYLNYSVVQAFKQWAFEPVIYEGKPVSVAFLGTYVFDPSRHQREEKLSRSSAVRESSSEELQRVLEGAGEYCRRLSSAVFDFICEERIKETHYNLRKNVERLQIKTQGRPGVRPIQGYNGHSVLPSYDAEMPQPPMKLLDIQIIDPTKTQRNKFLCDYLVVKKDGDRDERRIILEENDRRTKDRKKILEEVRFMDLSPLFAPLRLLAPEKQAEFSYILADTENFHGKKAYVIEAVPRYGIEDWIWSARVWIDAGSYQILKCKVEGIPIDGYDELLNDCARLNIKPIFITTHEYRIEKGGILFPSRSSVRVAYPHVDFFRGAVDKIKINFAYENYKFFTVETDQEVIKKMEPAWFLNPYQREKVGLLNMKPCKLF
jgi:TonB family protein